MRSHIRAIAYMLSRAKREGKERKGKERYKKSQNGYISRICTKAPSEPILAKLGKSREVADVITHANFGVYKLRDWGYTRGRILASPIEMASHPYSSAALPRSL